MANHLSSCRLCGLDAVLCDSHYLPQSLYKIVAQSHQPHESQPVLYDAGNASVLRSNFQPSAKLLCKECEGRFSRHGEDWICRQCYQGENKFRLRDKLLSLRHSEVQESRKIFWGPEVEEQAGGSAIVYFALSVLWRGSVQEWGAPFNGFFGALGQYEHEVRNFLLNPIALPKRVAVLVFVDFDVPSFTSVDPPSSSVIRHLGPSCHAHRFMIPGLRFVVLVGKAATMIAKKQLSFFEWSFTASDYARDISNALRSANAKGKLAKEAPRQL